MQIVESLKAVQKSISLTRTRNRLIRAKPHLESNVRGSLVELGRAFYEANPASSEVASFNIPDLITKRDSIQDKFRGHEADYEEKHRELKVREKEVEEKLAACNADRMEREKLLKNAEKDLKHTTARLKKNRDAILKCEKRKKRAMEYKTWIPAPLLSRKIEDLNQQILTLEGEIREKQRMLLPLKEELKQSISNLDAVKMDWVRITQEVATLVREKNRVRERLKKIRDGIHGKLDDAYLRVGETVEKDPKSSAPEFRPIQEKLGQEREQLQGLMEQIHDFGEVLSDAEFVRKRRAGMLWIMALVSLLLAAGIALALVFFG